MFYKKAVLKNFSIFTGKHLFGVSFNKVADLKASNFIKTGLQHTAHLNSGDFER